MSDVILDAVRGGLRIVDLGRQLKVGMPQSPNHPQFWHALPRRHGDMVRNDGGSAANDLIFMGTHVGTHIDALAHVSQDGRLYGGSDAGASCLGGKYVEHGVHTITPMVRRGVLLDVPASKNEADLPGGYEITVNDLEVCLQKQGIEIHKGDVVLIRSGWGKKFNEGAAYIGGSSGVPGIGEKAATWFAHQSVHALGADTIAFEHLAAGAGHAELPAHRVLLVEKGIYIIETLDLEELAADQIWEFTFVLIPLNIYGATGSPVRPLAVISS